MSYDKSFVSMELYHIWHHGSMEHNRTPSKEYNEETYSLGIVDVE